MKKLVSALVLTGLVAVPALAMADEAASPWSANIGLTTNYVFRGISQTQNGAAVQGGIDYTHPSGFYLGTWGSNVSWVSTVAGTPPLAFKDNNSMELDLYGGYRGSLPADISYDVGVIGFYYPGSKVAGVKTPDSAEVYAGVTWKFLNLKYSNAVSPNFVGWYDYTLNKGTRNSDYLELNANYDLGGGWGVMGHVGHQKVKNLSAASYTDYKVGVSKDVGFGVFSLAYTDTDANTAVYTWTTSATGDNTKKVASGHVFLSFNKTF